MVPTRGRRDLIAQMLESYEATRTPGLTEIVFRTDLDDPRSTAWLTERGQRVLTGPRVGYRYCCRMFREMAEVSSGSWLMTGNDDMVFTTPGWDRLFLDAARAVPDGVAILEGDGGPGWNIFPFPLVGRPVFDTLGFIHDERILWGDTWLHEVFRRLGRIVPVSSAVVRHDCQSSPHMAAVVPMKMGGAAFKAVLEQSTCEAVERLQVKIGTRVS